MAFTAIRSTLCMVWWYGKVSFIAGIGFVISILISDNNMVKWDVIDSRYHTKSRYVNR